MNEQEILNKAVETFGEESQIDKAIEECSELIQALCKYKRAIKSNKFINEDVAKALNNVNEEVADVQIMIKQLRLIFINADIEWNEKNKLQRLERRLNDEKNNRR